MFASGEVVPAQPSQDSHLLSPETSAAGSDNGQLDDLEGEPFSELVEAERRPHAKKAVAAAAATPSRLHQTQLKTPASLANPSTRRTSTSEITGKSETNTQQTSQKPGESNKTKMSAKDAVSAARRAAPVSILIVRLASSRPPSSSATAYKTKGPASRDGTTHSFTMNMLPMTKIRELCLHAAGHARRNFDAVLDGSRFEARDRDGHVFQGHETLSDEILSGETIYLIEGGLDARGAAGAVKGSKGANEKPRGSARERGRLLCLKSLELEGEEDETKTPYRTPSVSSRASSSRGDSKGKAGQARLTPSQKALAIAQMGRTPASKEPLVERRLAESSAVRKGLPSPALGKLRKSPDRNSPSGGTHVGDAAESDDLEATLVATSPLRSSSPTSPPPPQQQQQPQSQQHNLQDSQIVIPDSQDPFSQGLFSQQSFEPDHPAHVIPTPDTSSAQSHSLPRVKAATFQAKPQMSRPDPYDIDTVLSDDEGERSDESNTNNSTNNSTNTKMASSVRRLGSATSHRQSVAPPPMSLQSPRRHQSRGMSPSRANREAVPTMGSKTSTPTKKPTPTKAKLSSPAVPLPSSPTTHVAAAIAKGGRRAVGKNRQPQLPSPGQLVFNVPADSDSDDDLTEEAFRDLSGSIPTPSLPWSAPPLRAEPDAETSVDSRPVQSRSVAGSARNDAKNGTLVADDVCIVGVSPRKSPLKKPLGPSPGKKSSQKSPSKAPIITNPSKIEEATIIHDSSSAEASEEEQDVRIIKKEPPSNEESPSRKTRVADIPTIHENLQHEDERQDEVIELSSDSDSEIEPSADMLEDDEAELPNIEFELFMQRERPPSLPPSPARVNRSPMQNSPKTDPVNIEPAYKEPPPSAQTSKRKRPLGKEPDPEEKKHRRKRLKKEATDAKKQRDREQKAAMLLGETEEKKLAALQEERKKLALERAHRRALELEIIVSSPIKREPSIDLGEEGDDEDSGLGSSAYGGDDASADAGVQLDGDDKNDSLSSKEAEDHPASTPAIVEAQLQQCVEERFSRILFDDWAFLESTLGKGSSCGRGYSPLDVHNRVHLDMMQRAQHPPLQPSGEREPGNARTKDRSEPPSSHRLGQAGVAGAPARSRSQRSEAPSPKEHRMREMRMREKRKKRTKARDKLRQERARKRERGQKANGRYHQEFRGLRVGAEKTRKQKRQQKGH